MGQEPDPEKLPPSLDDFPEVAQDAIVSFNLLGDRVYPEIGYIGKDYTNLPILIDTLKVTNIELFLEVLNWLDSRAIKKSAEELKREYDKLKRKSTRGQAKY